MKTIFKTSPTKDFTVLPNSTLRDVTLTYKARGVLAMILSNSGEWEVTKEWIQNNGPEGREAISGAMKELESFGYAICVQMTDKGRFTGKKWTFYDTPQPERDRTNQTNHTPSYGIPYDGQPCDGNPTTKKNNNSEVNSEEDKRAAAPPPDAFAFDEPPPSTTKKLGLPKKKAFEPPTKEECKAYAFVVGHKEMDGEHFWLSWESREWKVGETNVPLRQWKSNFDKWVLNGWLPSQKNGEGKSSPAAGPVSRYSHLI